MENARVDFVDLSGGTFEGRAFHHVKESTKRREAYFVEFAKMTRPLCLKTIVYVTAWSRSASGMSRDVGGGNYEGLGIGWPLATEPILCRELWEGDQELCAVAVEHASKWNAVASG